MSSRLQIALIVAVVALVAAGSVVGVTLATRQTPEQPKAQKEPPPLGSVLPTPAAKQIRTAFRDFVRARLPKDCRADFTDHSGAPAVSLDWNMKPLAAAKRALTEEWGREAQLIGSGGSIPVVGDFKRVLGLDSVLVGFGLDDDNIHSPNEKYDLKSFQKGIRSWARILAALADAPKA